jgi:calcineurin-like phosphoesterase family protein
MNTSEAEFDFDVVDFVTSDHHFSHARIIELVGRPFASVEEMNTVMIDRWNEFVGPNDVVLHLGDLALGPVESSIALTSRLNGRRLLVPGNHDRVSPATQSKQAIERFLPMYEAAGWTMLPEILEGQRLGVPLRASHYPFEGDTTGVERHSSHRPTDTGVPLLHGHTHDRAFGAHGSHEFHVGVDACGFAPIRFDVIDAWLETLQPGALEEH